MRTMRTETVTETFTQEDNVTDPYIACLGSITGALLAGQRARSSNMTRELKRFGEHLDRPWDTATRADCEGFIAERVSVSIYSANYLWRALRSFYASSPRKTVSLNPVKNTKAPRIPEPATKVVTEAEYKAMLATVKARMPQWGKTRLLRPTFDTRRDRALLAASLGHWATPQVRWPG